MFEANARFNEPLMGLPSAALLLARRENGQAANEDAASKRTVSQEARMIKRGLDMFIHPVFGGREGWHMSRDRSCEGSVHVVLPLHDACLG